MHLLVDVYVILSDAVAAAVFDADTLYLGAFYTNTLLLALSLNAPAMLPVCFC